LAFVEVRSPPVVAVEMDPVEQTPGLVTPGVRCDGVGCQVDRTDFHRPAEKRTCDRLDDSQVRAPGAPDRQIHHVVTGTNARVG
jgi:hypothetical protein